MKDYLYLIKSKFLKVFGDIKVSKYPMWLSYCPVEDKIKGEQTILIMDQLEAGDVIMRAYDSYLDNFFIPLGQSRCSHSGIYLGSCMVAHSMAEGVIIEDLIDFCRTDRIVILRPKVAEYKKNKAVAFAKRCTKKKIPYDFDFDDGCGTDCKRYDPIKGHCSDKEHCMRSKIADMRYYCHEFIAACMRKAGISVEKVSARAKFLGLMSPKTYLADSFYTDDRFERILEI